jgi:tetratricopeptide (TPR) repeat protein
LEEGNLDDAIREYDAAVSLAPAMPNAYYGLGCVLLKQNRMKEAIPYFSEALRLNPAFTKAREQLQALGVAR